MSDSQVACDRAAEREQAWYGQLREKPMYCFTPGRIIWILLVQASMLLPWLGRHFR